MASIISSETSKWQWHRRNGNRRNHGVAVGEMKSKKAAKKM
jgi:hypothetical protein